MRAAWARSSSALVMLGAIACGGGHAEEPAPAPTEGAELTPPPPRPPPPPATIRVIHASPDPAAGTIRFGVAGAEPSIVDLAYRSASAPVELAPGPTSLVVQGVASVETGEAPELLATEQDLASGVGSSAILHGLAGGEPALALAMIEDRTSPPTEGSSTLRFFHAVVGLAAVDVCAAGASPRDPATPIFAAVAPATLANVEGGFAEVPGGAETVIQLRQQSDTACEGRVLGVARVTPAAGSTHTLVAVGRTTGAPRVDRELLVCTDGACAAVPITNR